MLSGYLRLATLVVAGAVSDDLCDFLAFHIGSDQVTCRDSSGNIDYSFDSFNPNCAQETPLVVVRARNDDNVIKAIEAAKTYAGGLFSVRGGGHSYTCNGFKKDSVHVDMRQWTEDINAPDNKGRVQLRPGHIMSDVLAATGESYGLAVGSCPTVGVMGYYLHGGSSPRTSYLGNATIESMQVITADGTSQKVNRNEGNGLFRAMTQAGSSFGVVTQLQLRLPLLQAPTISFLVPIANSFEQVQPMVVSPDFIKTAVQKNYWFGLFQFASFLGPTWYLKVTLNGASSSDLAGSRVAGAATPLPNAEPALVQNLTAYISNHLSNVDFPENMIAVLAALMTEGGIFYNYVAAAMLPEGESAELPPYSDIPWPAVGDAGSEGRFVELDHIASQSQALEDFRSRSETTVATCWYDMGPIKNEWDRVFMDLSCFDAQTVTDLREYSALEERLQGHYTRYYNLPMPGESREAYWSNYQELQALKDKFDPGNFFQVNDGIETSATVTV